MTPDSVAAVLTVVSGGLALWGLNRHLLWRVERDGRIAAEAALRRARERPVVTTAVTLTPKHRPYGPLESDPPGTATTGMLALSAPTPEPEERTEERLLGSWWPDPPPVDGWIELTPEAFEPVPRPLPAPTLINPVRSN